MPASAAASSSSKWRTPGNVVEIASGGLSDMTTQPRTFGAYGASCSATGSRLSSTSTQDAPL